MQRRLLLVLGLLGAFAGLALILALYLMEPPRDPRETVQAPPPSVAPPLEEGSKAERRSGTLRGRVVNGLDGAGIGGAKVVALTPHLEPAKEPGEVPVWGGLVPRKEIRTDAEGRFALEDLPPDYWNLWAEKRGYAWTTVPRAEFAADHEIRLFPACSVRGKVVYPDGSPAAGVRIEYHVQGTHSEVFSRYRLESYYASTRADGTFLYEDLPPGKFTVEVYPLDHLPAPWRFEPPLEPGENRDLGVHKLDPGFSMVVRVRWRETSEPVPDIEVVVRPVGDPMPRTNIGQRRRTDAEGIARFQGLGGQAIPSPRFLVAANVNDIPVLPDDGGMREPGSEVTIHLRKEGVVKGRVRRPNGEPLESFLVDLEPVGHMTRQLRALGEAGAFRVFQVPSGSYSLHVRHGSLVDRTVDVQVAGGEEVDIGVLTLEAGAQISGMVRRANGRDLEGVVRVHLGRKVLDAAGREAWDVVARCYALQDGSYILRGLAPGRYWIWPEPAKDATGTTDPVEIDLPAGLAALEKDLLLWGEAVVNLRFLDRHEGAEIHVPAPPVYLLEAATGREIRWMGVGTRLRPGAYTLQVELPDAQGVPRRYKVREIEAIEREGPLQADESKDPIEVRLFEIRDGN